MKSNCIGLVVPKDQNYQFHHNVKIVINIILLSKIGLVVPEDQSSISSQYQKLNQYQFVLSMINTKMININIDVIAISKSKSITNSI